MNHVNDSRKRREWLTVREVASHFGVSPKTVRKWMYERRLRYYRVGGVVRVRWEDVERFPMPVETLEDVLER